VWDLPNSAALSAWLLLLITAGAMICSWYSTLKPLQRLVLSCFSCFFVADINLLADNCTSSCTTDAGCMLHLKIKPKPWNTLLKCYPAAFQAYDVSIANPVCADNACLELEARAVRVVYRQA